MAKNLNRRKIFYFRKKNLIYSFFFLLLIALFFTLYLQKNFLINKFTNTVNIFSKNFKYQYTILEISGSSRVNQKDLQNNLNKYLKSSIFLLPLDKISTEIKENNWVKNVKLTTNFKNKLIVDLVEYEPIGIYQFNNRYFYFDNDGKIIDEIKTKLFNYENLIVFSGQSSNLKAKNILAILNRLNFRDINKINAIKLVEKRRWDIFLKNNIKLMLSAYDPYTSLQNYIMIKKKLSKTELNNIKYFDLRNIKKTHIIYNK